MKLMIASVVFAFVGATALAQGSATAPATKTDVTQPAAHTPVAKKAKKAKKSKKEDKKEETATPKQ